MSVEMTSGVLVQEMLEEHQGRLQADHQQCAGRPCGRMDELRRLLCSDDYLLGKMTRAPVTRSSSRPTSSTMSSCTNRLRRSLAHRTRWIGRRASPVPIEHLGIALTFAIPLWFARLVAGPLRQLPGGRDAFRSHVLNRALLSIIAGWGPSAVRARSSTAGSILSVTSSASASGQPASSATGSYSGASITGSGSAEKWLGSRNL